MKQNFNAGINIQLERKSWEDSIKKIQKSRGPKCNF